MSVSSNKTRFNKGKKIVAISLLGSILLGGCTQTNPAQIKDITDSAVVAASHRNKMMTESTFIAPYPSRPKNIKINSQVNATSMPNQSLRSENVLHQKKPGVKAVKPTIYTRNYDAIPKGAYNEASYVVKSGDTLFYIAWITGKDHRDLAAQNSIVAPYELNVGQLIKIKQSTAKTLKPVEQPTSAVTAMQQSKSTILPINRGLIKWRWPAKGSIVEAFSMKSKGIDIRGKQGDKIMAAAAGQIVYAGNALPGYGNLIIVKHNEDYLTAYAHNHAILVKEQQQVRAGEAIATMGNTGASSTKLHFEIRYKAKSVNPMKYLPKL